MAKQTSPSGLSPHLHSEWPSSFYLLYSLRTESELLPPVIFPQPPSSYLSSLPFKTPCRTGFLKGRWFPSSFPVLQLQSSAETQDAVSPVSRATTPTSLAPFAPFLSLSLALWADQPHTSAFSVNLGSLCLSGRLFFGLFCGTFTQSVCVLRTLCDASGRVFPSFSVFFLGASSIASGRILFIVSSFLLTSPVRATVSVISFCQPSAYKSLISSSETEMVVIPLKLTSEYPKGLLEIMKLDWCFRKCRALTVVKTPDTGEHQGRTVTGLLGQIVHSERVPLVAD